MLQVLQSAQANAVNQSWVRREQAQNRYTSPSCSWDPCSRQSALQLTTSIGVRHFRWLSMTNSRVAHRFHTVYHCVFPLQGTCRQGPADYDAPECMVTESPRRRHEGMCCGCCADLIHVGHGTPRKMVWPHGRGRAGIRRKYKSHLTVGRARYLLYPLESAMPQVWLLRGSRGAQPLGMGTLSQSHAQVLPDDDVSTWSWSIRSARCCRDRWAVLACKAG